MNSRKTRLLLWCGCLGAVVLFAGDMLFYGEWGSAAVAHAREDVDTHYFKLE